MDVSTFLSNTLIYVAVSVVYVGVVPERDWDGHLG